MFIASRYFATVLRATLIPLATSSFSILLSLSGLAASSSVISFLIIARIAVAEQTPPSTVPTWLEKKYLNS